MDHSTRTISVRTAQDLLVELIQVQFKIQHEETTTASLPLSLRIGFCDIRFMPIVDETIDLSIRERSIPFISLAKKEKNEKRYLVTIMLSSSAT